MDTPAADSPIPPPPARRPGSLIPLGILAIMLGVGVFLAWRWNLKQPLDDASLARALEPTATDHDTLHGAEELSRRITANDPNRKRFYPAVLALAKSQVPQKRQSAAWLMGYDTADTDFESALKTLIEDPVPVVRFNAAPALALHKSNAARPVLLEMLKPSKVLAPMDGVFHPKAKVGEIADWHHAIGVIAGGGAEATIEPTTPGRILMIAAEGLQVARGAEIATLSAGESPALNALVALTLPGIGRPEDAEVIEGFLKANPAIDKKVKDQAAEALLAVKGAK